MVEDITTVCNFRFHAYVIIKFTFDYKENKKHNTGYSRLSESYSVSLLDYKIP